MRVRRRYTVKGRTFRVEWFPFRSHFRDPLTGKRHRHYKADIDWQANLIRLDARLHPPRGAFQAEILEGLLRHELLHALLERPGEALSPHREWTLSHDGLAATTMVLDRILRTGSDLG